MVIIYNSGANGFINTYLDGPLSVSISGTFSNGTQYSQEVAATAGVVTTDSDGISLNYENSGFSFVGSNLQGSEVTYVMSIDSPDIGIQGSITWTSVSLAKKSLFLALSLFSSAMW